MRRLGRKGSAQLPLNERLAFLLVQGAGKGRVPEDTLEEQGKPH